MPTAPSGPRDATDAAPLMVDGIWDLRGRRILSWRNWELFSAGTYDRGEGEGVWRSTQHRLVFPLTPLPPILLQIDGGPPQDVRGTPGHATLYPAGSKVRTAGKDSRYAQVCWSPALYGAIAPDLPSPPDLQPDVAFTDPLIGPLVRALAYEAGQGQVDRLMAESLMAAIAMRVAQRAVSAPAPPLPSSRLRRVLDHIEDHLAEDMALAELAAVACLSPCHFSRSFKQAMGVGPQRYTVQRRVERAKELLRRTDASLAGIAAATGFADQSHFTAAFRRETGLTPGRFRAARA